MQMNTSNKIKELSKEAMLRNINGLSLGDKAYCGPYGTVKCVSRASSWSRNAAVPRKFSVCGSTKLQNRGNWTMTALRKAIYA